MAIENEEEKQRLVDFMPGPEAKRRSEKTEENMKFIKNRLAVILGQDQEYKRRQDFIDDLSNFLDSLVDIAEKAAALDLPPNHEVTLNQSRLSSFLTNTKSPGRFVTPNDFRTIVFFLDFRGWLSVQHRGEEIESEFPDSLFHSLVNFMDVGQYTLSNIKAHAPGLYRAYRPSSTFPGNYWVGVLWVYLKPGTDAVAVEEYYQSREFDDRPNRVVKFEGYLTRKGRHYTIISRNEAVSSLCVSFFPSVSVESGKITALAGGVLDMSTGRLYSSRIFYERVVLQSGDERSHDDLFEEYQRLCDQAHVCSPEELPKSIVSHFNFEHIPALTLY